MANIPMKDIQFPGLDDTYTFAQVDATLTTQGKAADAKKTGDEISELKNDFNELDETAAKIDGSYDTMTVGNAKQLASTVGIEDNAPYLFRTAGGANDIGDREEDTVVGGSVVWNQLVQNGNFADGITGWQAQGSALSISASDNVLTVALSGTPTGQYNGVYKNGSPFSTAPSGHKLLISLDVACLHGTPTFGITNSIPASSGMSVLSNGYYSCKRIVSLNASTPHQLQVFLGTGYASYVSGEEMKVKNVNVFDLTTMLPTAVADYAYSLEQTTAGAGIAWLKKYGFFTKDYYTYSEPTFKHVEGLASHKMTGFNQWDEQWELGQYNTTTGEKSNNNSTIRSKNKIKVVPNTSYYMYVHRDNGQVTSGFAIAFWYDADENFLSYTQIPSEGYTYTTPSNAYYMAFFVSSIYGTTYKNDICINIHWDGERDGEYEAYKEYTYPLDDSLTLMGIPKLDANNNLYYDGDTYEADGTVTRNYFKLTLTGDETYHVYSSSYIKSDACDGSVDVTTKKIINADTYLYALCNKLIATNSISIWSVEGNADKFALNGGTQLHINIANSKLGITDYTQETTTTVAEKIKAYVKSQYDAGTPLEFTLPLPTPTTETADPFQTPQIVDDWGTEEYVYADGAFPIPVGHNTFYAANLKAKLEMSPDSPGDGDGDYIVRQTNGLNEYVKMVKELPSAPTTDGSYHLEVTVASGTPTLTWVANE